MGQRHQIYLRLPEIFYFKGNPNNQPERTIGIHHQWLYGRTALRLLNQFLTYSQKTAEIELKSWQSDAMGPLTAAYSFHAATGYSQGVCALEDGECSDPMLGANNNGITIIDLCGPVPRYCFLSLHHLECLDIPQESKEPGQGFYENLQPIDAETWLTLHYSQWKDGKCRSYKNNAWEFTEAPEVKKDCEELIAALADLKAELLTTKRIKEIFPKLPFPKSTKVSKSTKDNLLGRGKAKTKKASAVQRLGF